MKEKNVLTPRGELYKSQGVYGSEHTKKYPFDWSPQTILSILCNEVYIGYIVCKRHQTNSFKSKKLKENPKDEWIITRNKHEPIIDKDLFVKVQNLISENKKTTRTNHLNIFKGKIRCNECGKTLSLSIREDRNVYGSFACSTYRKYGKSRCSSHYITYDYLVSHIIYRINTLIELSKLGKDKFFNHIISNSSLNVNLSELEELKLINKRRLLEINKLIKTVFEKYINEKITEDKFYDLDRSYDNEKNNLIKSIRETDEKIAIIKRKINDINSFYKLISQCSEINNLSTEHILKFINSVIVKENKDKENKRIVDVSFILIGIV